MSRRRPRCWSRTQTPGLQVIPPATLQLCRDIEAAIGSLSRAARGWRAGRECAPPAGQSTSRKPKHQQSGADPKAQGRQKTPYKVDGGRRHAFRSQHDLVALARDAPEQHAGQQQQGPVEVDASPERGWRSAATWHGGPQYWSRGSRRAWGQARKPKPAALQPRRSRKARR